MPESPLSKFLKSIGDHVALAISLPIAAALITVWSLWSEKVFLRLQLGVGSKGILGLLFASIVIAIWGWLSWRAEKKKEISFFDRLIPIPGAGYSKDPRTGEFACPKCASEGRTAYVAHIKPGALYCQACGGGTKRFEDREK